MVQALLSFPILVLTIDIELSPSLNSNSTLTNVFQSECSSKPDVDESAIRSALALHLQGLTVPFDFEIAYKMTKMKRTKHTYFFFMQSTKFGNI